MKRPRQRTIIIILVAGLAMVWFNALGLLNPAKAVLGYGLAPLGRGLTSTGNGVGNFFDTFTHVNQLAADNTRLNRELTDLRLRLSQDGELRVENDALRRQLNFSGGRTDQLVPAQVVAYQPDNFRQYLTINRGSADGLKEGQAVVSEGYLVGKIVELSPKTAKVFLVTDPTFKTNGIDQETRATGTVHGQIGTGLIMEKIAQSDTVRPGDTVITSGLDGGLPRGLLMGRVESVSSKDNAVFQSAQMASGIKFTKLELVFVVTGQS